MLVVAASCVMAMNIKSFVRAGGLFPGGFTGLTLLIQQAADKFFHFSVPYSAVNLLLNLAPIMISFRFIGKKFTLYSCCLLYTSSFLYRNNILSALTEHGKSSEAFKSD